MTDLKCPNCGGPLTPGSDGVHAYCNHCESLFDLNDNRIRVDINKQSTHNINTTYSEHKTYTYENRSDVELARIAAAEEKRKDKEVNIILIVLGVLIAASFLSLFLYTYIQDASRKRAAVKNEAIGRINAGYYKDYSGINYEAAVKQLEALGFTNITLIDLKDALPIVRPNDTVSDISINANSKFDEDDYFDPSDLVIIKYH